MSLESRMYSLIDDIHDINVRLSHLEDNVHCLIQEYSLDGGN